MPFARYFCIFINVGLGEAATLHVGNRDQQISDIPSTRLPGGNGNFVIRQPDGLLVQIDPTNKSPHLGIDVITDYDDGIGVDKRSAVASATLPSVGTFNVVRVILPVTTRGSGAKSSNTVGL
ncbi:hypothetical protein G869_02811 [Escherichia coli HVH 217 (4-1022806)]|nr:hypothetical protein G869_02811 [Escherichia coli HVH 217 (4-1022806)]